MRDAEIQDTRRANIEKRKNHRELNSTVDQIPKQCKAVRKRQRQRKKVTWRYTLVR